MSSFNLAAFIHQVRAPARLGQVILLALSLGTGCDSGASVPQGSASPNFEQQTDVPTLEVLGESPVWDAGMIRDSGLLRHIFTFRNPTSQRIHIGYVARSCNCTDYELASTDLEPAGVGTAMITLDPTSKQGAVSVTLQLFETESSRLPLLTLGIQADCGSLALLKLEPARIDFHEFDAGIPPSADVRIVTIACSMGDPPDIDIGLLLASAMLKVEQVREPRKYLNQGHVSKEWVVRVSPIPNRFTAIGVSLPVVAKGENETITDTLFVAGEPRAPIMLAADAVFVGSISHGVEHSASVGLRRQPAWGGEKLIVAASCGWITATIQTDTAGRLSDHVGIQMCAPARGRIDESLELRCGEFAVRVPIRGWAR